MNLLRAETSAAIAAVREGLLLARRGAGDIHSKVGRDVVTDADVAVEDLIRQSLTESFPRPVIGEERGGEVPRAGSYWLVDPICGTRNFASGIPLFAVNVALVEEGSVSVSVVGDGSAGDVLVAEAGHGAWRLCADRQEPISASSASLVLDFGAWPTSEPERGRAARRLASAIRSDGWDVRSFSTSLSLAYVATGQIAGCVFFAAPDLVHIAAGSLLVTEAGGRATDTAGAAWTPSSLSLVCSADERVHDEILGLLNAEELPA